MRLRAEGAAIDHRHARLRAVAEGERPVEVGGVDGGGKAMRPAPLAHVDGVIGPARGRRSGAGSA